MLEHSFLHLAGVGAQTEQRLWSAGICTWEQLESDGQDHFGAKKFVKLLQEVEASRAALDADETAFFTQRLPSNEMWRLIPLCRDAVAFLDIETTGLGFPPEIHSTSIAVSFQGELFVEHQPEKKLELMRRLEREAKMFVTFNGLSFDLPFLRRETQLPLRAAHLDLRVWLRRLGYTGGLKKIQMGFPEVHQRTSQDIDGFDAVRLWRMHKRGVPRALETLMTYNAEDTVVLESLMHLAFDFEVNAKKHLPLRSLGEPQLPLITTQVDGYVYDLLRGIETWEVPANW